MFDRVWRYAPAGAVLLLAACGKPATRPQAYPPQLFYPTARAWPDPSPDPAPDSATTDDDDDPAPAPRVVVRRRSAPPRSAAPAYLPPPAPAYTPVAVDAAPAPQPAPPPLRPLDDPPRLVAADRSCGWWRLCEFWQGGASR